MRIRAARPARTEPNGRLLRLQPMSGGLEHTYTGALRYRSLQGSTGVPAELRVLSEQGWPGRDSPR